MSSRNPRKLPNISPETTNLFFERLLNGETTEDHLIAMMACPEAFIHALPPVPLARALMPQLSDRIDCLGVWAELCAYTGETQDFEQAMSYYKTLAEKRNERRWQTIEQYVDLWLAKQNYKEAFRMVKDQKNEMRQIILMARIYVASQFERHLDRLETTVRFVSIEKPEVSLGAWCVLAQNVPRGEYLPHLLSSFETTMPLIPDESRHMRLFSFTKALIALEQYDLAREYLEKIGFDHGKVRVELLSLLMRATNDSDDIEQFLDEIDPLWNTFDNRRVFQHAMHALHVGETSLVEELADAEGLSRNAVMSLLCALYFNAPSERRARDVFLAADAVHHNRSFATAVLALVYALEGRFFEAKMTMLRCREKQQVRGLIALDKYRKTKMIDFESLKTF